jgi:uncharacterized protein YcfJ
MNCKFLATVLAASLAIGLSGCTVPSSKLASLTPNYYPQCYNPILELCKDDSYEKEIRNAAAGAIAGAIIGALAGAASGKSDRMVAGALVGAGVGALGGVISAKLSKIRDQNERLNTLHEMLGKDAEDLDLQKSSVLAAMNCYSREIDEIQKKVHDKTMTREEAAKRMTEIRTGMNNLKEYWQDKSEQINKKVADYDQFMAAEDKRIATEYDRSRLQASQARSASIASSLANSKSDIDQAYQDIERKFSMTELA